MDEPTVPTMTHEQMQIPALCSQIYALPSKGRTSDLDHFVRVTVPSVLNVVQMSVSTTTLARVKHLTKIITGARAVRITSCLWALETILGLLTSQGSRSSNQRVGDEILCSRH